MALRQCNFRSLRQRWSLFNEVGFFESQQQSQENYQLARQSHMVCEMGL
jgi:hypothetical protein